MSDLIDRQAAIEAVRIFYADECALVDSIEEQLEKLPSAQPKRIKGRWIGTDYDGFADGNHVYDEWKCSICGYVVEDEEPTWNFCPNCGADMRGDENE